MQSVPLFLLVQVVMSSLLATRLHILLVRRRPLMLVLHLMALVMKAVKTMKTTTMTMTMLLQESQL